MALFKKRGDAPPDVGQEGVKDNIPVGDGVTLPTNPYGPGGVPAPERDEEVPIPRSGGVVQPDMAAIAGIRADLDRVKMHIQALESMREPYNERFGRVNEQVGELRSLVINNEKELGQAKLSAMKASDLITAIHPEKLSTEFHKQEAKIESLRAKLESNEEVANSIIEEIKEMRGHIELFRGSERILKLNEEIKNELIQVQKIKSIVESRADKAEQVFIELQNEYKDIQRVNTLISNVNESISGLSKEVSEIKIRSQSFATKGDVEQLRQSSIEFSEKKQDFVDKKEIEDALLRLNSLERNIGTLAQLADSLVASADKSKKQFREATTGLTMLETRFEKNLDIIGDVLEGMNRKIGAVRTGKISRNSEKPVFFRSLTKPTGVNPIDLSQHLPKLLERFRPKEKTELAKVSEHMLNKGLKVLPPLKEEVGTSPEIVEDEENEKQKIKPFIDIRKEIPVRPKIAKVMKSHGIKLENVNGFNDKNKLAREALEFTESIKKMSDITGKIKVERPEKVRININQKKGKINHVGKVHRAMRIIHGSLKIKKRPAKARRHKRR